MAVPDRERHPLEPGDLHRERQQSVAAPSGRDGWIEGLVPNTFGQPRGNALFAFALL